MLIISRPCILLNEQPWKGEQGTNCRWDIQRRSIGRHRTDHLFHGLKLKSREYRGVLEKSRVGFREEAIEGCVLET